MRGLTGKDGESGLPGPAGPAVSILFRVAYGKFKFVIEMTL